MCTSVSFFGESPQWQDLSSHHFFIEPTRRTPHLCGIVLAMGLVIGHTLLSLLAFAFMIPNWYHNTSYYPLLFLLRHCAHRIDIALTLPNFCDCAPVS